MTFILNALRNVLALFPGITFLPDFLLAVTYLAAWIQPGLFPAEVLRIMGPLLTVEFIVMHSTALMGACAAAAASDRAFRIVGLILGVFYVLFLALITASLKADWLFVPVAWLVVGRALKFMGPMQVPGNRALVRMFIGWFGSAVAYCVAVWLAMSLWLPQLGTVDTHARAIGTGFVVEAPHRVLAFGVLYFFMVGALHFQLNHLNQRDRGKPDTALPAESEAA